MLFAIFVSAADSVRNVAVTVTRQSPAASAANLFGAERNGLSCTLYFGNTSMKSTVWTRFSTIASSGKTDTVFSVSVSTDARAKGFAQNAAPS
jgi:hypothetical protein